MVINRRYSSSGNLFNVRSFGARGDGWTDDTDAVQRAINACQTSTTPGGVLYFPKGSYLLVGTAEWRAAAVTAGNMMIRGDGIGVSRLVQADAQYPVIGVGPDPNSAGYLTIENLSFIAAESLTDDGNDLETAKGSLLAVSGAEDNMIQALTIQNCEFQAAMRRCIWLKNIRKALVDRLLLQADAGDDHLTAVKPGSGSWHLYLGHNIYADADGNPTSAVIDSDFGSGGGVVVVHNNSTTVGEPKVHATYGAAVAAADAITALIAPDINGRRRWWVLDGTYDTSTGVEGTDWFTNAGGQTYRLMS